MSAPDLSVYDKDPTLYLVTSLTAGNSHIVSATSRMETILRANKIPFVGVDTATDDRMRSLWGRRARGKRFPGLVREGFLLGDLEQIEEWNEFGELHDNLAPLGVAAPTPVPAKPKPVTAAPISIPTNAKQKTENIPPASADKGPAQTLAMRQMAQEAAEKGKEIKTKDKAVPVALDKLKDPKPKMPPSDLKEGSPEVVTPVLKSPASPAQVNPESGVGSSTAEAAKGKTHRGSSVSIASEAEIKSVENANKIDEEDEDEDEDDEDESEDDEDDEDGEEEAVTKDHVKPIPSAAISASAATPAPAHKDSATALNTTAKPPSNSPATKDAAKTTKPTEDSDSDDEDPDSDEEDSDTKEADSDSDSEEPKPTPALAPTKTSPKTSPKAPTKATPTSTHPAPTTEKVLPPPPSASAPPPGPPSVGD